MNLRGAVPLLTVLLLGACAQPPSDTGSPAPDGAALAGRTFLSTGLVRDGKPYELVKGTRITLTVHPDGRIGAIAGCNSMGGAADLSGGRLRVDGDGLATTDMGCSPELHAQDKLVADLLTGSPRWELSGDVLTLRTDAVQLTLQDQETADPDRPLPGTRWSIESIVDKDSVSSVASPPGDAYLEFADGKVSGSTGCNQLGGTAVVKDDKITFSGVFTTRRACPGDLAALEKAVLNTLRDEATWRVTADRLALTAADGHGLHLRASAAPSPSAS
ncbi:META domain-containing protein [Catellatospora sp. NPDC049609]|uniref:META domain-containing protein n=1 Tax=Catellatospora sp. NPDC049609 TaxID=3155505 RepID=UPI003438B9C9